MAKDTKQGRINIVNQIIKEIASRGRRFFCNSKTGRIGEIVLKNNRLYYKLEWHPEWQKPLVNLSPKHNIPPINFNHGGTLWRLMMDFKDFIQTGEYSNHNNGYGGLYCPHWGYPEEDMKAIQQKAIELGYLPKVKEE